MRTFASAARRQEDRAGGGGLGTGPERAVRRAACALAAAAALAAPSAAAPGAAAAAPYPVTWSVAHGFAVGTAAATSPPGANDWHCKPTARHPDPVVLVHGASLNMGTNWDTLSPLLANNGFCVFALTYGAPAISGQTSRFGGLAPIESDAPALGRFVDRVLAATGAEKVDLVGHSEGTLMPRWWMNFLGGARKVRRYVLLTPLTYGTSAAGAAALLRIARTYAPQLTDGLDAALAATSGEPALQYMEGSPWMDKLNAGGVALPGVRYTNIATKYDTLELPYTNGFFSGALVRNITVQDQCASDYADHLALAWDPTALQDVLNALDPAHARAVPCQLVLPGVGAPGGGPTVGLG